MRIFNRVTYETALPFQGSQATLFLNNGKVLSGRVLEVRHEGILFHSANPGLIFLPFAAIALLALSLPFAFGLGYGLGARPYRHPGYAGYPYPY